MYRAVVASLVLLVVSSLCYRVEAKIVPYRKLTDQQRLQIEASEQRLEVFDRKLQAVEVARRHHQISRAEYGYEVHELTAFIADEARLQDDILIDNHPLLSDDAQDVMSNIVRYGIIYPAEAIGYLAVRVGPGLAGLIR
jgi:lipopolysaccharide biosynthesis regulator YciM